ncbi:OPT family oligopeptide transporter [Marichromatium bheemlicum]|uniref:OPT family oligopeptide transporter n=1 Tax=Marichromatium bheemlicum TaxID=365339 RepID=A0ABX1I4V5_9GAMM|nr:OPT family oligopeptide transporter [Marichromatium bheemlicum]NKN31939.1 OPT family oligopeptide transporter [Marichromatium bheemlicum]
MDTQRQLSTRALISGALLGALLTPCNVYAGLKIGWSFNVSIVALLITSGLWAVFARLRLSAPLAIGEGNITQTTASSAANIISGGLVAPIPALAMLSGDNLPAGELIAWVFAVSFLGIWVAWYLRAGLIVRTPLPFPTGRATAETLQEMFRHGHETRLRLRILLGSGALAAAIKWLDSGRWPLPRPGLGFELPASGALAGAPAISAKNLTLSLDPSLMLAGFGAIIGVRAGLSLLLGALIAWALLGPLGLYGGFILPGANDPTASWFATMIEWLLWPGVALLVAATLTRLVIQLRAVHNARTKDASEDDGAIRMRRFGLALASALVVLAQTLLFDIHWLLALLTVPIAFVLAMVAARVVGETGIPPIGAIGKVSQLSSGITAPGDQTANLIGANVAGGAAGQSADLLNDFKAGHAVGTAPGHQVIAQCLGVAVGSLVGSLVYLQLIPDPATMLITEQWPAPAVATWKVVAETLDQGLAALPPSALTALLVATGCGITLTLLESRYGPHRVPSAAALGLAMVIPASLSLTLCLGSLVGHALARYRPRLAERFLLATAAGLIAGESLSGVGRALLGVLG